MVVNGLGIQKQENLPTMVSDRLVKYGDLNHHGTLFAGRGAEWFVECGFIMAASITNPKNIVCVKVHGMHFRRPVNLGTIVFNKSKVVLAGRTSLVVYVYFGDYKKNDHIVDGFLSFVYVDENGKPKPHGVVLEEGTEEEKRLQERAIKETSWKQSKKL